MNRKNGFSILFLGSAIFIFGLEAFSEPVSAQGAAMDPRFRTMVEGPRTVKKICSQCHAVKINGQCFAGDCENGPKVRTSQGRNWSLMIGWMREIFHCQMTDEEAVEIAGYLNLAAPGPQFSSDWKEAVSFQGGFNVPAMKTFGNALYAGIEGNPKIYRTEDGKSWKEVLKASGGHDIFTLEEFKGALYAGVEGEQADLWRSKDGIGWEKIHTFPYEEKPYSKETGVTALGLFKGYLYAGTYHLRVYRTPNGVDWEEVGPIRSADPSMTSIKIRFLKEFNGSLYAGSGYTGKLYRSMNGVQWEEIDSLEKEGIKGLFRALVFDHQLYIGTRMNGTVWRSKTGDQWEKVFDLEKETGLSGGMIGSMIAYQGRLYLSGTASFANAGVYRSPDGLKWEGAGSFSPFDAEAMAVFHDQLFVATIFPRTPKVFQMIEK